ncbi:MAG: hypothetical protein NWR17_05330 [Candidatus Nanopelagicales bacterium]|jgi:hypothetical protein|nr:hypothetical protein [Candidatus Nanopelagicales bacterium]MDP4906670.1 hypothetical protein [Candidatus Nanopelagicales bacterium]MDP4974796.1 hypothetical protein [Candidatus Nanopelagicales bacterium]MDP5095762.1 hypothetical protein [Candidatus Nanopelagicales bacterium]
MARSRRLQEVLESAARLQQLVPDAVLVGGSAAALHAGHRESFDHDHVLVDLDQRYAQVLEAVEASEGWATSVRASRPPLTIMGSLDGVQAGLRNLRRTRPLETVSIDVAPGTSVIVPTLEEMLRVKAYLVVQRNVVRDYLDVVAIADHMGIARAGEVLRGIDDYYDDLSQEPGSVRTNLALALVQPSPRDVDVIPELPRYRGLDPRWHEWSSVVAACATLALEVTEP